MNNFTIAEVAEKLRVHEQTLRKWEKDFDLIIPRNPMGHRYYTEKEIALLENIKNMKENGANIHVINKIMERSIDAQEQREEALELVTLDKITGKELKEMMTRHFADILIEREMELEKKFEEKLDVKLAEQEQKIREQLQAENQKLIGYIESKRDEKKSIWSRILGK